MPGVSLPSSASWGEPATQMAPHRFLAHPACGIAIAEGQEPTVYSARLSRRCFSLPAPLVTKGACVAAFQPMPMRLRRVRNRGLSAEGFVELGPRPGEVLAMRLAFLRGRRIRGTIPEPFWQSSRMRRRVEPKRTSRLPKCSS